MEEQDKQQIRRLLNDYASSVGTILGSYTLGPHCKAELESLYKRIKQEITASIFLKLIQAKP